MIKVGDIVKVKPSFLGNDENSIGYVYEVYADFDDSSKTGVSVILKNGADLGGFSFKEQGMYLEKIKESGFAYQFSNIMRLSTDYNNGVFTKVFE